jgi:hypothetical protein
MNQVGEVVFLGSAGKAHVDFNYIGFEVTGNKKIDSQIHRSPK